MDNPVSWNDRWQTEGPSGGLCDRLLRAGAESDAERRTSPPVEARHVNLVTHDWSEKLRLG
jgi:hypothetical protein